jgi:hypothetical protein
MIPYLLWWIWSNVNSNPSLQHVLRSGIEGLHVARDSDEVKMKLRNVPIVSIKFWHVDWEKSSLLTFSWERTCSRLTRFPSAEKGTSCHWAGSLLIGRFWAFSPQHNIMMWYQREDWWNPVVKVSGTFNVEVPAQWQHLIALSYSLWCYILVEYLLYNNL